MPGRGCCPGRCSRSQPRRQSNEIVEILDEERYAGKRAVAERGAQTVETVTLQVAVKVPLVGGKLETLVSDMMRKALAKEYGVGQTYLAG